MKISDKATNISQRIHDKTKLGDLRLIAKEIKKDHELALELWQMGSLFQRLLSILIMDTKQLDVKLIEKLFSDMEGHPYHERIQLADWLMANQLVKHKTTLALLGTWNNSSSAIKRRLFWYHQGRLRWVGQTPPDNTQELLKDIEQNLLKEPPEVQWAMNFTAGWIGVYDPKYRKQCIHLGEKSGLYKDEVVAKGCTPSYLPLFIDIETKKRKLN